MQPLNLPEYSFRWKVENNNHYIFDGIRKKFLLLTPEEWVRQNITAFLIEDRKFPPGLISAESGIKVNTLSRRYDILVYSKNRNPLVLVECKAPHIKITQKVFDQIIAYNYSVRAAFLLVTNGLQHFFLRKNEGGQFIFCDKIPEFQELTTI